MCKNLKSCNDFPDAVKIKIQQEVILGRVRGPFSECPLPDLKISPIGIVPKKVDGQFRLIHHLSHPKGSSVNDSISRECSTVQYSTFEDAVAVVLRLGKGCLMAKTDIDSAFRLIPIHPEDYNLLGLKFNGFFYHDIMLPMGASSSCSIFNAFSSGLKWIGQHKLGIPHIVHILDDFMFFGPPDSDVCNRSLHSFLDMCSSLGVPTKNEKTEEANTCMTFMGLELDSQKWRPGYRMIIW